jgi:hypothetical protein
MLAEPASALLEQMFQFTTLREKARPADRTSARSRGRLRGGADNPGADLAPASSKSS